jgi:peptide/nickel transport system substrate-binding protein
MLETAVVENDGKLWRLTLREGLRFHDNEPVLGKDVVASIKRWGKRDIYGGALMAVLDELSAPSDRVVEFRLSKPFPLLPNVLGKPISYLPAIMPERIALTDPTKQVAEIIGSGPFKFVAGERNPGALNVYEKFTDYVPRSEAPSYTSGAKIANFDRVEWHTLPDPATAAAALQAGEMDWWEQPTSDLAPLLRSNSDIQVQVTDPAGYCGLLRFNHLQPPFDNAAIRHAILGGIVQSDYMLGVVGDNKRYGATVQGSFNRTRLWRRRSGWRYFLTNPTSAGLRLPFRRQAIKTSAS